MDKSGRNKAGLLFEAEVVKEADSVGNGPIFGMESHYLDILYLLRLLPCEVIASDALNLLSLASTLSKKDRCLFTP